MQTYYTLFPVFIAIILVIVKLLLEHQQQKDRMAGCEDAPENYTFSGMIKLMRAERREKKLERKAAKRAARTKGKVPADPDMKAVSPVAKATNRLHH